MNFFVLLFSTLSFTVACLSSAMAAVPARAHIAGAFGMLASANDVGGENASEPSSAPASIFKGPIQGGTVQDGIPVYMMADELSHDRQKSKVTAQGNVEFAYGNRLVRADVVTYDTIKEQVNAKGHVELEDENGDIHRADEIRLNKDMGAGFVRALRSTLADGSRLRADTGERKNDRTMTMMGAVYTPCLPCKKHPNKAPTWSLKADEVTHDAAERKIKYEDATLEMWGIPVAYTPYFSHPDGSVKQKSGFLAPSFKMDSHNGVSLGTRYYWGLAPDRDATFGTEIYTKQAPRLSGEYRQRFDKGSLALKGSTTYSSYKGISGTETIKVDDEIRGHIDSAGKWDVTDTWRSGYQIKLASDEQYFRQYDVTSEDVLENQIYAERLDNRDYMSVRMIGFQDLRTSALRSDQPSILPEIQGTFYGSPGGVMGGRWRFDGSFLGLERGGDGADMARGSARLGWQGRHVADIGLVTTLDTSVRGDVYHAVDRGGATDVDVQKNKSRFLPIAHMETRYPLGKRMDHINITVEPVAAVTLVTHQTQTGIPNEDSQDIQVDAMNLFEANRFPGLDRVEDTSRATFGMRIGGVDNEGSNIEAFLGQSYRFKSGDQDFPDNSGLDRQSSDIVGNIKMGLSDKMAFDYGFQLGSEDLASARHEIGHSIYLDPIRINTQYLFARQIQGIGIDESREQIQSRVTYKISDEWSTYAGINYDLGIAPGLRRAVMGVGYDGQCLSAGLGMERRLIHDTTGESGSELMLRIGFKNLGTVETSGISISPDNNRNDTTTSP